MFSLKTTFANGDVLYTVELPDGRYETCIFYNSKTYSHIVEPMSEVLCQSDTLEHALIIHSGFIKQAIQGNL